MKTTKAFKKTMAVLMISVAGFTSVGCDSIPKPFDQDVPETKWVVDENGKKQKVVSGENSEVSNPQQVTDAANEFYASVFNDDGFDLFMKNDFQELSAKANKIDPNNPKELAAYKDELSKTIIKLNPKFMTLINFDGSDAKEKNAIVYEVFTGYAIVFLFTQLADKVEIKVEVPISAVKVKGDTAEVDMNKAKMKIKMGAKEETKDFAEDEGKNTLMKMVKLDGKWMVVGKSILTPTETEKK